MSRRPGLLLGVTCMCGLLALSAGCREDLIDQTPVNDVAATGLAAPTVDSTSITPDGRPAEATAESAEAPEAGQPAPAEEQHADAPAPAGGGSHPAPGTPSNRQSHGSTGTAASGGASASDGDSAPSTSDASGARTTPAQPAQPSRRSNDGASGGNGGAPPGGGVEGRPGSRRGDPFERWDASGDGLLQKSEIPQEMRERFMQADSNGDGAISQEEVRAAMPRPGSGRARRFGGGGDLTPEQRRQRMMERMDTNGDGKLTLDEMPERMRERMKAVDTNGDGVLSEQELEKAREQWGQRRGGGGQGAPGGRRGGGGQGND